MKKRMISIAFVIGILVTHAAPLRANSAPTRNDGTPSAGVLAVEENCPVTVEHEQLTFDLQKVDLDTGFGGRVAATYQMNNPLQKDVSVQMAFPYITALRYLAETNIAISADNKPVPFTIYCSYERISHRNLDAKFTNSQLDIQHIMETVQPNQGLFAPEHFTMNQNGYLYKFKMDSLEVQLKAKEEDPFILFDDFTYSTDKENSRYYQPEKMGENIIFSLKNPVDFIVEWKDTNLTKGMPQYEMEAQRMTVAEYLQTYQLPQLEEMYPYTFANALHYAACVLDTEIAEAHNPLSGNWIDNQEDSIRVLLLVYQVDFKAEQTQTVTVEYPSILTINAGKGEHMVYEQTYLLNPARYWASFKQLDIVVKTPPFAPYVLVEKAGFTEEKPGVYRAGYDTLPSGNLTFSLYKNPEIPLGEKLSVQKEILVRWSILVGVVGAPLWIALGVFILYRIIKKPQKP